MARLARIFALAALVAAGSAGAQEARSYPPYPEVWGRELPAPPDRLINGFFVRDYGNGDFLLTYSHYAANPITGDLKGSGEWARIELFGGNASSITADEADTLRRRYPVPKLHVPATGVPALALPNGRMVMPALRERRIYGCEVNYAGALKVLDKSDRFVADKVVLRRLERPESREYWDRCEQRPADHYLARVDALAFVLYPLADGTFVGEATGTPFIIRFRPDLTSPFIDANPNLFLVDTAEVDRVLRRAYAKPGLRIQVGNDALADYIARLKKPR